MSWADPIYEAKAKKKKTSNALGAKGEITIDFRTEVLSLATICGYSQVLINSILLQASMDLPPDKAKLLKNYDYEKKWDIICDQVCITFYPNCIKWHFTHTHTHTQVVVPRLLENPQPKQMTKDQQIKFWFNQKGPYRTPWLITLIIWPLRSLFLLLHLLWGRTDFIGATFETQKSLQ